MSDRPRIQVCPLARPPVDADLRCGACQEQQFDATVGSPGRASELGAAGRCARWLVDRTGRAVLAAVALQSGVAGAAELQVSVRDDLGAPVELATVRAPSLSETRLRVDVQGVWRGDTIPRRKQEPVVLQAGPLELEVAAPGYRTQQVQLKLRGRRVRKVVVVLEPLTMCCDDLDEVEIVFGRRHPID